MHPGTCVTHVPWCMSGSLTCGGGENVPAIPGACATRKFTYLVRGPCVYNILTAVNCLWTLYFHSHVVNFLPTYSKQTQHRLSVMANYWECFVSSKSDFPDNKVHGANMGPIWGRQDPGGPHVGPMNFAIWLVFSFCCCCAVYNIMLLWTVS